MSKTLTKEVEFDKDHPQFGFEVIKIYFSDSEGERLNVRTIPNPNLTLMFDEKFLNFIAGGIQKVIGTAISQLETNDGKRVFKPFNESNNKTKK